MDSPRERMMLMSRAEIDLDLHFIPSLQQMPPRTASPPTSRYDFVYSARKYAYLLLLQLLKRRSGSGSSLHSKSPPKNTNLEVKPHQHHNMTLFTVLEDMATSFSLCADGEKSRTLTSLHFFQKLLPTTASLEIEDLQYRRRASSWF